MIALTWALFHVVLEHVAEDCTDLGSIPCGTGACIALTWALFHVVLVHVTEDCTDLGSIPCSTGECIRGLH